MIVRYRVIKYEAETQEDLDRQMGPSLAEGVYPLHPGRLTMSIRDLNDKAIVAPDFWEDIPTRSGGCITNRQLKDFEEAKES